MGKQYRELVANPRPPHDVEPSDVLGSSVHHSFDVPTCSPLRRLPPRPRSPRYVNEFFFYRTSRSHVSTSMWDDASGARWVTDERHPSSRRPGRERWHVWSVKLASRRCARDAGERTRGESGKLFPLCLRSRRVRSEHDDRAASGERTRGKVSGRRRRLARVANLPRKTTACGARYRSEAMTDDETRLLRLINTAIPIRGCLRALSRGLDGTCGSTTHA